MSVTREPRIIEVVKRGQKGRDGNPGVVNAVPASASMTLTENHRANLIRCTNAITLSLDPIATLGAGWVCMIDAVGGAVTIDPSGSEQVEGGDTATIPVGFGAFIYASGGEFYVRHMYSPQADFNNSLSQLSHYSSANGADGWIVAANIDGDTSVSLLDCEVYRHVVGDLAFFSYYLKIGGFSKAPYSDGTVSFRFDVGALGVNQGWERPYLLDGGHSLAWGRFSAGASDFPDIAFYASAHNYLSAYPNTFFFRNTDRKHFTSGATLATGLEISGICTARIKE